MQAFDLFVLPSTVEAMPLTILEAMAARVPVVATAIFGVPEVVRQGETGLLVPPGDVGALAESVRGLLEAPSLRVRLGRAARQRYEDHFTVEQMARATADAYRDAETHAGSLHAA